VTEVAENTLVDSRYRILRRIGSGGMADVYCAEDTHLGREVALKVLHRRFAQDEEFVERFRREASAAAGLQHPNVVGVFDRGKHDGTYYIAMEYLPGRTLKEIVATEAPLDQARVVDLGIQILEAAGFAHRHGVIHRDFKPHNVIVDEVGQAKVTDFGIARAGASEMTETGSIMGTAQYLSPEQAQGHAVTAASDLYSIGVMFYEMLARRLPFEGDSAVAVALKHLSEPPPPISHYRPDVHPALESVVMAALAKDPAQRWQSAEDFAAGLAAAGQQLAAGPAVGQDTAAFAPIPMPVPVEGDAAAPAAIAPVEEPRAKRRRRWPWFTIGLLTLALAAFLIFLAVSGLTAKEMREVPRVTGTQLIQAREILERAGFEVEETRVQSEAPLDRVLDQDPDAAVEAEEGSTVVLEVSGGPGTVRVPSLAGLRPKQVVNRLENRDLTAELEERPSDTVQVGLAIRSVPGAGEVVERGEQIKVFISSGPELVAVPNVVGLSREAAEDRISDAGLGPGQIVEQESEEAEGEVLLQDPASGSDVERGTAINLTVSTGIQTVDVPNVIGIGAGDAGAQLRADGLAPVERETEVTDPADDGKVIDQRPAAGTEVEEGRPVVIIIGVLVEEDVITPGEEPPDTP
jgi:beta-lactam-binding protein with PASTA domain/predicted Ser/Thr protein kinase